MEFQLPQGPQFDGLHEASVKLAKRAIVAMIGNADITDEKLQSTFAGVEQLLNLTIDVRVV